MTIWNQARYQQKANYDTFILFATDGDMISDLDGKGFCFTEFKCEGTDLQYSQRKTYQNLLESAGQHKPTWFVLAKHDTRASEDITGENSYPTEVWFRGPFLKETLVFTFPEKTSLNVTLAHISQIMGLQRVVRKGKTSKCPELFDDSVYDFLGWYPVMAMRAEQDGDEWERDFILRHKRLPEWHEWPGVDILLENEDELYDFAEAYSEREVEGLEFNDWKFYPLILDTVRRMGFVGSPSDFFHVHWKHFVQHTFKKGN